MLIKRALVLRQGASAPEILVEQVVKKLKDRGGLEVTEVPGIKEEVVFSLPKELTMQFADLNDR